MLTSIVDGVRSWLPRQSARNMKLTLDCDSLEVTGVSSEAQDRLVEHWIGRTATPLTQHRLALIVALSDYCDPTLHRLRAPGTDAEAFAEVLSDPEVGALTPQILLNRCHTGCPGASRSYVPAFTAAIGDELTPRHRRPNG